MMLCPHQVQSDLQSEKNNAAMLDSDLLTTSSSLEQQLKRGAELEEEITVLKNCLQQVMGSEEDPSKGEGVLSGGEEGFGEEGEEGTDQGERVSKEVQLKKIEAMLDTTKVRRRKGGRERGLMIKCDMHVRTCNHHYKYMHITCVGASPVERGRGAERSVHD